MQPSEPHPTTPVLIGYFPKRMAGPPGAALPAQVEQVCNAGNCGGFAPEGWVEAWRHNELGVYDTEAQAWSVVAETERAAFELHAYRLFPVLFVPGGSGAIELPAAEVDPLPADWERLGYDAVSHPGLGPGGEQFLKAFGHSPLSPFCNGQCGRIPVNRFCLLETEAEAFRRAGEFASGGGEPEPYVVVEVWRKKQRASVA